MAEQISGPVLVAGATGSQGGAVARALRARGHLVRALVRDPAACAARALADLGATLVIGAFEDPASLEAAATGAAAVFSMQTPATQEDRDAERKQGQALIEAARRAGVRHFVQSSALNAGEYWSGAPDDRPRGPNYWASKADVEEMVAAAHFPAHTFLRPGFFMENLLPPKVDAMFPDLARGQLVSAMAPTTCLQLIAVDDIAAAATAAIENPARFGAAALPLVGDVLTPPEIASALSRACGADIAAVTRPAEDLLARGMWPRWVKTQQRYNLVSRPTRPDTMERFGLTPTRFADWVMRYADRLRITPDAASPRQTP